MDKLGKLTCSEDFVEYRLFVDSQEYGDLNDLIQKLFIHINPLTAAHIWQNEPFNLQIYPETNELDAHLYGRTKYGDNVEDEWFIVYLLLELSKQFPGLVVQVQDNDGEFLLIEAADHLPRWLEPDTAENRIFLYGGDIHIIPLPKDPAQLTKLPSGTPTRQVASQCVRAHSSLTRASPAIQEAISRRIHGFPEKAQKMQHRTHCYIPAPLAAVLNASPHLVAPMVHAFYYRDPVDLKACVTFNTFRPGTRILSEVRMTKCLYAQLMQQEFTPDRRSGYTLPAKHSQNYKAHDLGVKLAHGAEILCSRCGSKSATSASSQNQSDSRWNSFLEALKDKGYFKGEIEGSQLYNQLAEDARRFFSESSSLQTNDDTNPGHRILELLKSVDYDVEEMRKKEKDLPPPDDDGWLTLSPEQLDSMLTDAYKDVFHSAHASHPAEVAGGLDDSWLTLSPEQLDSMLTDAYKDVFHSSHASHPAEVAGGLDDSWLTLSPEQLDSMLTDAYKDVFHSAHASHPAEVAGGLGKFVNHVSSHEGAEFPGAGEDSDDEVTFDPNSFIQNMQKMFDFKDEKDTSSEDDMSEYGSDDDPDEMTFGQGQRSNGGQKGNPKEMEEEMREYMEQMDRELAKTSIGKSFVTNKDQGPVAPPRHKKQQQKSATSTSSQSQSSTTSNSPQKSPLKNPTASTNTKTTNNQNGGSFSKMAAPPRAQMKDDYDIDDLDEDFEPVNVDVNLVHNLLESHSAQQGLAGPASNILGSMGLKLPQHNEGED